MDRDPHLTKVLWECPVCTDTRWYTKAQVRSRKRCPTCARLHRSARHTAVHADRQIKEFWNAGQICLSCGKRFWQQQTDGGYYRRCTACRSRKHRH